MIPRSLGNRKRQWLIGETRDDSERTLAVAGGILGAMYPNTVNQEWVRDVESVNQHQLETVAHRLASLRGMDRR